MKTVVLAWELGGGLGHIASFLPIVKGLKEAGFRPFLVFKDISSVEKIYKNIEVEYTQAPTWQSTLHTSDHQESIVDTLFHSGYLDQAGMLSMTKAWMHLLSTINPSVLITDFAPTALLANKVLRLPTLIFGNSFSVLPKTSPMPPYQSWLKKPPSEKTLRAKETKCLQTINTVLQHLDCSPLDELHELYNADHTFIRTDKLLDVYKNRDAKAVEYLGAISTQDIGDSKVLWPSDTLKKIFVYIKPSYEGTPEFLNVIKHIDAQFMIYCPGLPVTTKTNLQQYSHIIVSDTPYRINTVREECDYAIIHGGNLIDKFLEVGVPVFLLPMQMEHLMMAHIVSSRHIGMYYHLAYGQERLKNDLQRFLSSQALKLNAQTLAPYFLKFDESVQVSKVVEKVKEISHFKEENEPSILGAI